MMYFLVGMVVGAVSAIGGYLIGFASGYDEGARDERKRRERAESAADEFMQQITGIFNRKAPTVDRWPEEL